MSDTNTPRCPNCGATCVPMRGKMQGKGWNCSKQTWSAKAGRGGCSGVVWNKGNFNRKEKTPRAQFWPLANCKHTLTIQQQEILLAMSQHPEQRGGRLVVIDAVAGSAKSFTMSAGSEKVYKRVGITAVANWYECAFNVNARDSLESKTPAAWPNIGTINGTCGKWQGYNFRQYKPNKIGLIFREMTKDLPKDQRPKMGPLSAFAERAMDMLAYCDNPNDTAFWSEAVVQLCCRFPGLDKRLQKSEGAAEVIKEYLAPVLTRCLADNKVIDLTEQYARPALLAIRETGWRVRWECMQRGHVWTDDDVKHFATLIRAIKVPQVAGVILDESQDLSPSQVAIFLAATWRNGELILVGDDRSGEPGTKEYKAGQSIFGWRGAGGGWLALIPRLWKELTGETAVYKTLSTTFRLPTSGVEYIRSFCERLQTARTEVGEVRTQVDAADAYQCWLDLEEGKSALWLTRKNAPLGGVFMSTMKDRKQVCLRGGGDFAGKVDSTLFESAGWYDDKGEYNCTLSQALAKMAELRAEEEAEAEAGAGGDDSLAGFLYEVGNAIRNDPTVLLLAKDSEGNGLRAEATVGNLRRFVTYFAHINAPRICSTVYRSKGDEADLVVVDDLASFNESWGCAAERNSVVFVAGSRQRETLLVIGDFDPPMNAGDTVAEAIASPSLPVPVKEPIVKPSSKPKPFERKRAIKPVSADLFSDLN